MKTLVLFDPKTGNTQGYIQLSRDADAALYDPATSLIIPNEHPAMFEQSQWHVKNRTLVKING